jgi:hypothetical protein
MHRFEPRSLAPIDDRGEFGNQTCKIFAAVAVL